MKTLSEVQHSFKYPEPVQSKSAVAQAEKPQKSEAEQVMDAFDRRPAEEVVTSSLDFDNILTGMGMDKLIDDLLDDEDINDSEDEEESKELFEEMRKKAKR